MIKLTDLLNENVRRDFTFSWYGDQNMDVSLTTSPETFVFSINDREGFEGVDKSGRSYSIHYKGEEYDLEGLLKLREIKKKIKEAIKRIAKRIDSIEGNLKYADHGAYGQDVKKIKAYKEALEKLKKYK